MANLRKKTENGIKWSAIDQIFRLFVTLAISAILARFISPAEYGLFAMVSIITGFLSIFKDFGLGNALIYKSEITDEETNNVFWVNNLLAFVLGFSLFCSAPYVAEFYAEPRLIRLTQAMAILFMIGSTASIPDVLIRKNIDFKSLFTRNILNLLLSSIVAIIFAYMGFGVWALVIQGFISTIAGAIISFKMVKWRPKFVRPRMEILKPFFSFSLPLLGENTINYWVRNVDSLLIGKLLGEQTLGYYSRSYNLMLMPVRQISGAVMRVVFPVFSMVKHDKHKVWYNYKKLLSITAFITFPLMSLMYILGEEIILIMYGPAWIEAIPIFKGLCFLGALQSIGTYCGSIFSSQGKTMLQFKIGLFLKPYMICGIILGLYSNGIMGLVYGYTIASGTAFLVESYFVMMVLEKKFLLFFGSFVKEAAIAFLLLIFLFILKHYIQVENIMVLSLIVTLAGLSIYLLLARMFKLEGYLFLREKLNGIKKNR